MVTFRPQWTLAEFGNNVVKFNTWFEDTMTEIINDEGEGYNKYHRQLFRVYLTCNDAKSNDSVTQERRLWT